MNKELLIELNRFMGRASKENYASGGGKVEPWRKGFKELEFRDRDWYYRDSYTGFLRSWGQEVIWYQDKPAWTCLYGGGMEPDYMDVNFANQTFTFLKKAFLTGDKETKFQPRGPAEFQDGDWHYHCAVEGDIQKFKGHELITYQGKTVFTHDFLGGLVVGEDQDG
jgi:hypothetical protein